MPAIVMKHHAEPLMKDENHDRIAPERPGGLRQKLLLRWILVIFCLVVWIAVAAFFIW
ncbi:MULTISPECIES: hypothetical protein [Rhizobium]|uniref:hypothetical protein n=1 Tax=Rhizobium TaxID=379 RepID=UPI0013AFE007|nr:MULTISPECIES: hypothetical protein [Rhizobium]MCZ3379275.1 hypothetical protein [Rhizobium sp. AG207R]QYA16659.1 hypothetical protein J5284_27540 [Rhizobium sp. AB2/73]UEQ84307.1 hypothetical protein I8E17_28870 [Rhizobium sp. AB2/73]